jgi:hypothetical protein
MSNDAMHTWEACVIIAWNSHSYRFLQVSIRLNNIQILNWFAKQKKLNQPVVVGSVALGLVSFRKEPG